MRSGSKQLNRKEAIDGHAYQPLYKSKVVSTALQVLERSDKGKYDELAKEIEKIKAAPCVNEIDRIDTFCDRLSEDEHFVRALLVVSISEYWKHDK